MKIGVTGCGNCPLKKVSGEIRCKVNNALLMSKEPGGPDYVSGEGIHPDCRLLGERIVLVLDARIRAAAGGTVEAFLRNRVLTDSGTKGVVIAKYQSAAEAKIPEKELAGMPDDVRNGTWYRLLKDGGGTAMVAAKKVREIIKDEAEYNFNPDFPFQFGFGEAGDEE